MTHTYTFETTAEEIASHLADRIQGKVILTTGVTQGGLGAHFMQVIAAHNPKLLILAGRSISKLEVTARDIAVVNPNIKTRLLQLDLSSQTQIR